DEYNPLDVDAVVIDEASMLDLSLMNSLLKAIAPGTQLLLIGDADQLPSVGAGAILRDLIHSATLPIVRLTQIYRQSDNSDIALRAAEINEGRYPRLQNLGQELPSSNCLWLPAESAEQGYAQLRYLFERRLPELGFDPVQDVQTLAPKQKGKIGVIELNRFLQESLNPTREMHEELQLYNGDCLRVGDRVLQCRNNYDADVFNGDLGTVKDVIHGKDSNTLVVEFSHDRLVGYGTEELSQIRLAYALTIHKSQGSEYPCVVLPMFGEYHYMLSRCLFYTGLTRAKCLVVVVGNGQSIRTAIRRVDDQRRFTRLTHRLIEESARQAA
ncbi:MAG: AAA family ATPase, partial [Cyanobacteria bacterium P01_H01_bin.121]